MTAQQIAAAARVTEGDGGVCCIAGGGALMRNSVLLQFCAILTPISP